MLRSTRVPSGRRATMSALGLVTLVAAGCVASPNDRISLRQSQLSAYRYYQQNQTLAADQARMNDLNQSLMAEKARLEQERTQLQSNLEVANQRLDNLSAERGELQQRYISLLNKAKGQPSPLSNDATRRFEELAKKYPEFEFDPQTGVSKFHSDILFNSGSAEIKPSAMPLLQEFSKIMNDGEAQRLNILVVGHTDDKPISKPNTRQQHPTNWHLSTNRADSVVVTLAKFGLRENRMGAAGYSMYQPVVANKDDKSRQMNRRVEIFVLAPDAVVAGWEPGTETK